MLLQLLAKNTIIKDLDLIPVNYTIAQCKEYLQKAVEGDFARINYLAIDERYRSLGADDVVTVNFSGFITKTNNAVVAIVPAALVANISNIFFTAFEETPNKGAAGGRIDSSGKIIINNAIHRYVIH